MEQYGGLGCSPGQVMWDLWWSISFANSQSSDYSTLNIIYHPGLVRQAK
jgi:hypothetical protein